MLADPKANSLSENFAAQWLLLTHLRLIMKNGKVYKNTL